VKIKLLFLEVVTIKPSTNLLATVVDLLVNDLLVDDFFNKERDMAEKLNKVLDNAPEGVTPEFKAAIREAFESSITTRVGKLNESNSQKDDAIEQLNKRIKELETNGNQSLSDAQKQIESLTTQVTQLTEQNQSLTGTSKNEAIQKALSNYNLPDGVKKLLTEKIANSDLDPSSEQFANSVQGEVEALGLSTTQAQPTLTTNQTEVNAPQETPETPGKDFDDDIFSPGYMTRKH